jgi:ubiquinone/menaquinone biosynthesis C-methylase UbiE
MLKKAEARYTAEGIDTLTFLRADIGRLPFSEAFVDRLLTMNGFHAFPDKDQALYEIATPSGKQLSKQ